MNHQIINHTVPVLYGTVVVGQACVDCVAEIVSFYCPRRS